MELPNESATFVVILVLFYFHLGRICDLSFSQKRWKSFYSQEKNILFSYDIIRGIQQATSISFFPSVGNQSWNRKKTHFALCISSLLFIFSSSTSSNFLHYHTFCTLGQPIRAQLSCSLTGPTLTNKQQRNFILFAINSM